jgi:hypothetical protein
MDEMATKDVMEDRFGLVEADNSEGQGLVKYREEGGLSVSASARDHRHHELQDHAKLCLGVPQNVSRGRNKYR